MSHIIHLIRILFPVRKNSYNVEFFVTKQQLLIFLSIFIPIFVLCLLFEIIFTGNGVHAISEIEGIRHTNELTVSNSIGINVNSSVKKNMAWGESCVPSKIEIDGIGMGDGEYIVNPQILSINAPDTISWMMGQVAGRTFNGAMPNSVTFASGNSESITVTPASNFSYVAYNFFANLVPADLITATVNHSEDSITTPRGFVLYSKRSTGNDLWSYIGRTANEYIYKDNGDEGVYTEIFTFGELAEETDLYATVVVIDNNEDSRPVIFEAEAGGVLSTITHFSPTHGKLFDIMDITLKSVPTETNQISLTVRSPVENSESFVLIGMNVNYLCSTSPITEPPTGTLTINKGDNNTNSPVVTATWDLPNTDDIETICLSNENFETLNWNDCFNPNDGYSAWQLSENDGPKTVYMLIKNQEGLLTLVSDNIFLDSVSPTSTVLAPQNGDEITGFPIRLFGYTQDALPSSGIKKIEMFIDDGFGWRETVFDPMDNSWEYYTIQPIYGNHIVKVRAYDNADNIETISGAVSFTVKASNYLPIIQKPDPFLPINNCYQEPNDSNHIKGPLAPNREYCEQLDDNGYDVYFIDLDSPSRISVSFNYVGSPPLPYNELSIWDINKKDLAWDKEKAYISLSPPEILDYYYVVVYANELHSSGIYSYTLEWSPLQQ